MLLHRQNLLQAEKRLLRGVQCPLTSRMVRIPVDFLTNKSPPPSAPSSPTTSATSQSLAALWRVCTLASSPSADCYEINTVSTVDSAPTTPSATQKPHLALVHGWGGGLGIWMKNFDTLSERYQKCATSMLMASMGKIGASSRPPYRKLHSTQPQSAQSFFVESLEAWRVAMGIDSFTLCGHSMGGYVSASYAIRYPQHLDKLVLLSPIGLQGYKDNSTSAYYTTMTQRVRSMLLHHAWTITPQRLIHLMGPTRARAILGNARRSIVEMFPYDDDTVSEYVYWLSRVAPGVSGEAAFAHLGSPAYGRWHITVGEQVRELQKQIPIVLAYGISDWIDPSYALFEMRHLPSSSYTHSITTEVMDNNLPHVYLLRGAGHHAYIENSTDFARVVMDGEKGTQGCGVLEAGDDADGVATIIAKKRAFSIA